MQPKSKSRRLTASSRDALFDRILKEIRARAAKQARAVHQLLNASLDAGAVTGACATLAALDAGTVTEILVTPRYVEAQATTLPALLAIASARRARVTSVTGMAALELDLHADGIGGMLRPQTLQVFREILGQ